MIEQVIVLTLGSFIASFVNGAFATGGVYLLLAASAAVFPLTVVVPLQSILAFSSLIARVALFWQHIVWAIVIPCTAGALIGVAIGSRIFVSLSEHVIALLLGLVLLVVIWFPKTEWRLPMKHPFFLIGGVHAFIATLFGVGGLLQPSILRTSLLKMQITGTLASCLLIMDVFKLYGYFYYGFNYLDYLPHILAATIAGIIGTWCGKRITHRISEQLFRTVFKTIITLVALRFLYRGLTG
ncbi:MAG: sulfite exporter TauE/SafE family protein [Gammaproteobacteria bacterium]|nr:sulfite exporter TauE/SafE family protein [Gammaproteobacteria bacterium]